MASLRGRAVGLGAAIAAVILPAATLVVAERLAALCATPHRCPSYGLAPGCPPHAQSPARFREALRAYKWVLVFKIEARAADLQGAKRCIWPGGFTAWRLVSKTRPGP